jgi:predicted DNA-binding WGR domain protein
MLDPCFHLWQRVRWENAQSRRYYEARVAKNLLDEWEVLCLWGGIGTRLGGSTVIHLASLGDANITLEKIDARRTQRHYLRVIG